MNSGVSSCLCGLSSRERGWGQWVWINTVPGWILNQRGEQKKHDHRALLWGDAEILSHRTHLAASLRAKDALAVTCTPRHDRGPCG